MEITFKMSKTDAQKLYNSCEHNLPAGLEKFFSEAFKKDLRLTTLESSSGLYPSGEKMYFGTFTAK